ncbi:discoidin domain-containing protein, partial [Candidatus Woesearchaeota archaeon]|nr:discoidin domain-containing protein [Candidatus Woesearchaeota archaeon]
MVEKANYSKLIILLAVLVVSIITGAFSVFADIRTICSSGCNYTDISAALVAENGTTIVDLDIYLNDPNANYEVNMSSRFIISQAGVGSFDLILNASNLTLNLNNSELYGSTGLGRRGYAIAASNKYNLTLKNGNVSGFHYPVNLSFVRNVTIENITIDNSAFDLLSIHDSNNINISSSTFTNGQGGIVITSPSEMSHDIIIANSQFFAGSHARIEIYNADGSMPAYYVTVKNNNLSSSFHCLQTTANYVVFINNTCSYATQTTGTGGIFAINLSNAVVANNTFYENVVHIVAQFLRNSTINNNVFNYSKRNIISAPEVINGSVIIADGANNYSTFSNNIVANSFYNGLILRELTATMAGHNNGVKVLNNTFINSSKGHDIYIVQQDPAQTVLNAKISLNHFYGSGILDDVPGHNEFCVPTIIGQDVALNSSGGISKASTNGTQIGAGYENLNESAAIDGLYSTMWASSGSDAVNQWLEIDLRTNQTIMRAKIVWVGTYGSTNWSFQYSTDDTNWNNHTTTFGLYANESSCTVSGGNLDGSIFGCKPAIINNINVTARYWRVLQIGGNDYAQHINNTIGIWEFELYNTSTKGFQGNFYADSVAAGNISSYDCGAVNVTNPDVNSNQTGNANFSWKKQDSSKTINYTLQYSNDSGTTWFSITATTALSYLWDTSGLADLTTYLLKVIPFDGTFNATSDQSAAAFTISNPPLID